MLFFFGKGFLQNIRAPSVSMRSYVGRGYQTRVRLSYQKRLYACLQRLSTKLYSRIAQHQQHADQEAQ